MNRNTKCRKEKTERIMRQVMAALLISGVSYGHAWAAAEEGTVEERPADVYTMDDVIVTAERVPTSRMDTPANVSVITAEEIEANHYGSVAEALEHVNGVFISNGISANDTVVRLNGDERVVVMVDGRRINNDQGSMTRASANLGSIPSMKNIERIEVVKGGGSALYGSDAIGGVINIITKKGDSLRTTLDVNAGSWGTYNYELSNEGSIDNLSWYVTGGFQRSNDFDFKYKGSNRTMPNSDQKNNSFTARVDFEIDDCSSVRLDFEHKSIHAGAYKYDNYDVHDFTEDAKQDELFNNVALSYHFKEGTKTPGFLRVYNNYKWEVFGYSYPDFGPKYPGRPFTTQTTGVDYQNGWTLGEDHTLVAGAEWRQSKSSNDDVNAANYRDETVRNSAIYLQDTWKFAPKWSLVPGVRFDHHSMFGSHWSPKAAVNYNADDKTQVYASWGRVYKAPTVDDLYYKNFYTIGDPNLKPESGHTETIGITHKIDDKTTVSASYFWSELHDAIFWWYNYAEWKSYATNIAYERKHGLELSVQKKFDEHWSVDASYSYIKTDAQDTTAQSMAIAAKNPQPNGYRLGVHFRQGAWEANLMATIGSGLDTSQNYRYYNNSNYTLLDFNASYDITKNLTAYFRANNLLNQEYQISPGPYPGKGRFFQIGLTCSF